MSRIGKSIIEIPAGVTVTVNDNVVTVKGPKGELSQEITGGITLEQEDGKITVNRPSEAKNHKALHGLYRALINNMVVGTSEGFSHGIVLELPSEITIDTLTEKGKNPIITLSSYDKQLLGMVAAKIRSFRKPEPYKGKGVKFVGEIIRRKAGKSA